MPEDEDAELDTLIAQIFAIIRFHDPEDQASELKRAIKKYIENLNKNGVAPRRE